MTCKLSNMKILMVGMLLPNMPSSGEDGHIKKLALELINRGHQVDVLTVIPDSQARVETANENGINFIIIRRQKPYMYHSIVAPINEIYDDESLNIFYSIMKQLGKYDIIHYHSMYPLATAEYLKQFTDRLIHTMHGTYIINPLMHTYSALEIQKDPYGCIGQNEFTTDRFTKEYIALTGNQMEDLYDKIYPQMQERLDYGRYLLEEVFDDVISNGYFGLHAYLDFGVNPKKISIIEFPVNNKLTDEIIEYAENKYSKRYSNYVYSYLSNWQHMKGQHTFVKAFEYISANNVEGRLYGEMNINPAYKNLVAELIENNKNLRKKIKLKGAYKHTELKNILDETYIHVNTQAWKLGQTGSFYEALMNGLMQIWTPSVHTLTEMKFKDEYYINGNITDKNLYKLYDFEFKYADKPKESLYKLYTEDFKDYIFDCGDYKSLAKKIEKSIGKNHFNVWLKLAQERQRQVNYTFDEYLERLYGI